MKFDSAARRLQSESSLLQLPQAVSGVRPCSLALICSPRRSRAGSATGEVAGHAGRLLERSLLGELRSVAARALSGLDMFSGDLSELVAGDAFAPGTCPPDKACVVQVLPRRMLPACLLSVTLGLLSLDIQTQCARTLPLAGVRWSCQCAALTELHSRFKHVHDLPPAAHQQPARCQA